ncbi:MAG: c-type cytochrome, partial [Rhizobiaceae bacterium]
MKRLLKFALVAALLGLGVFWWLTRANAPFYSTPLPSNTLDVDLANGELVFWASGCASCHAAKDAEGDAKLLLGGGHRLKTPFGTFVTPNISPDEVVGVGNWTLKRFENATLYGVSSKGHYYPSFPYASYSKMEWKDIRDLFGYLKTLPPVSRKNEPHELALPFQWRRPLGIWKRLFLNADWAV